MPITFDAKQIKIDPLHVYIGSISAFVAIPIFILPFPFFIANLIIFSNLPEIRDIFMVVANISSAPYGYGLFSIFPPLFLLPGIIHGAIFNRLQSRNIKTEFLGNNPLLQKVVLLGAPSVFVTLLIFGLIGTWGLLSRVNFNFEVFYGDGGLFNLAIGFPIVLALLTILITIYTYLYWKRFGLVITPRDNELLHLTK